MKITWGIDNVSHNPSTITTLGSYDGVHLGHQKVLSLLSDRKRDLGLERSLVVTFHPHPQEVLRKSDRPIELLTTIQERIELLSALDIDELLIVEFTKSLSETPYEVFFRRTIVEAIGTKVLAVGFNHAFGKNREGDTEHLQAIAPQYGVEIDEMPAFILDEVSISSTKIRNALYEGNAREANSYLGRNYAFSGTVVEGDKLGRVLGYPTANLELPYHKLVPADGIYAVRVHYANRIYDGIMSIGTRPTVTESLERKVEVMLFDFDKDIYGDDLKVELIEYIRPQQKFSGLEPLKAQMFLDCERAREILASAQ